MKLIEIKFINRINLAQDKIPVAGLHSSERIPTSQQSKKKSAATALNTVLASAHIQ
jgi:hypothetical protein